MSSGFSNIINLINPGIQKICVDSSEKDKENLYVCDSEGYVLKFSQNALKGSEPPKKFELGDYTSAAIGWNKNNLCIGYSVSDYFKGTGKKVVGNIKNDNFESESVRDLLEFELDITSIDINEEYLVAGSNDFSVKCVKIGTSDINRLHLEREPTSIKIDPKNEFVAVASIDGLVTILSLKSFKVVESIKNVFPKFDSIDVSRTLISLCWSTSGDKLFVPSKNCVKSINRSSWDFGDTFSMNDSETHEFSTSATSSCGKYLAASTMSNTIGLWDLDSKKLATRGTLNRNAPGKTVITSIEFSPFGNTGDLIIADSNKGICVFHPFESSKKEKDSDEVQQKEVLVDSDDDDELILNRTTNKPSFLDEESMEVDDENSRLSSTSCDIAAIKKSYGYDNQNIGNLEEFGFTVGPSEPSSNEPPKPYNFKEPVMDYMAPPAPRKVMIPDKFVCNSSPMEMSQRYLKYNQHGIVKSYINEQVKTNTIDIEFHNKSLHGDINLDNFETNYELADISLKVVALASFESRRKEKEMDKLEDEVKELGENDTSEKKGTSEVLVIPISSFDNQRWTVTLPRKDGAIDVLVSETHVVVLTVKRNIRIFTISGVQRQIFTHPGPILTAACFEGRIAIASVSGSEFYEAETKKIAQWKFEVNEYRLEGRDWYKSSNIVQTAKLPISMGESLEWLSYSTQGKLIAMDSLYNVHMLSPTGLWIPIFDGSLILRSQSDGIFPLGLAEHDLKTPELRYIYCRGTKYPLVSGINSPKIAPIKLPFCQPDTDRTKNEHDVYMHELAIADAVMNEDFDAIEKMDKRRLASVVKLFALAIKCNSEGRAVDLAQLVGSSKGIQMLCNYASSNKKSALSEKVAEIGRQTFNNQLVSSSYSTSRRNIVEQEEELRPSRKIAIGAPKKVKKKPVERAPLTRQDIFDENDEEDKDVLNSTADESLLLSQPIIPLERKRQINEESRMKRGKEGPPAKKQAKLTFGGGSNKKNEEQKENKKTERIQEEIIPDSTKKSVNTYKLWLSDNHSNLKSQFSGEDAEFSKFCIQKFRGLSKSEKKEWKVKAQEQQQEEEEELRPSRKIAIGAPKKVEKKPVERAPLTRQDIFDENDEEDKDVLNSTTDESLRQMNEESTMKRGKKGPPAKKQVLRRRCRIIQILHSKIPGIE